MKKYFKLFLLCLCITIFATAKVSAEEFYASDFEGAVMQDRMVSITEDTAEIVYEWYSDKRGKYNVSFDEATCSNCDVRVSFKNGNSIRIDDITKKYELAFDAGFNSITLSVTKKIASSTFSVGLLTLEYIGEVDLTQIEIECNNYVYADAEVYYYDNYGTDMSLNDLTLYRRFNKPAEVGFLFYAPVSGEYSAEIIMSVLNQTYSSDVNMCINGTSYPLKAGTVKQLASLTNASDKNLIKKYGVNNTVTLKQGINSVVFTAIETRNADNLYLFFLDYINFKFMNEEIIIDVNEEEEGIFTYPVKVAKGAKYYVEIAMSSDGAVQTLPNCEFSADGVNYTLLTKGTVENGYNDSTVQVVSEYLDDGYLYGVYRIKTAVSPTNSVSLKIGNASCRVERIVLIPEILEINEIYAVTDKAILVPGEKCNISVFATDVKGYTLNLNYLREKGAITFKTSDRNMLATDAEGQVVAINPGNAEVVVSATDGTAACDSKVNYNVYDEKYGFTIIEAKKGEEEIQIKLLSPFGTKSEGHTMVIAEYEGSTLINVESVQVSGLNKGQIVTYNHPSSENTVKIISLNGLDSLKPMYEVITLE